MSASHSREQSVRMNILSRRSLREKLMAYLSFQQMYVAGMDEITIPLSLAALAEYLCVDRSAMMREIKRMNDDGLICSQGRKFTILEKFRGD
jgi:DNA-binding MarR family transcriptional regulator